VARGAAAGIGPTGCVALFVETGARRDAIVACMSWGHHIGTICLAALTVLAAGCASADVYDFEVQFDNSVTRSRVAVVHTEVRRGGCSGPSLYTMDLSSTGNSLLTDGTSGQDLDPGTYGFAASVRDNSCSVFAEDCVEVQLPQAPSPVVVTLMPTTETTLCFGAECVVGLCTGVGAGSCTPACSTGSVCCGTECCLGSCGACGTGL